MIMIDAGMGEVYGGARAVLEIASNGTTTTGVGTHNMSCVDLICVYVAELNMGGRRELFSKPTL